MRIALGRKVLDRGVERENRAGGCKVPFVRVCVAWQGLLLKSAKLTLREYLHACSVRVARGSQAAPQGRMPLDGVLSDHGSLSFCRLQRPPEPPGRAR